MLTTYARALISHWLVPSVIVNFFLEKGETEAAVEVGRLKLKEFFGIEDEGESKAKPEVRVNKLNVDSLFSAGKSEQEVKLEKPEVKKLNIKEAFNPESQVPNETPKATQVVGKLNVKKAFSVVDDDEQNKPEKVAPVVNKLNISKAFPVHDQDNAAISAEKPAKVGKLNMGAVFQNQATDDYESSESPQKISPGKLDTSKLFQDSESNEDNKSGPKSVGKLNMDSLFSQNDSSEPSDEAKPKVEVGKLNLSNVFGQKDTESEDMTDAQKESLPQAKKLDLSQFLQSNADLSANTEKDIPTNIGKLNVNSFVGSNDCESEVQSENETVKVGKLKINSEMFVTENEEEQKARAEKLSRAQSIRKIDKSKFLNSLPETSDEESKVQSERPLTVGKLNVNAMKFAATDLDEDEELEQNKRERTQTISKIDTSNLFVNNDESSETMVQKEVLEVGKLNVAEMFQLETDEKLEVLRSEKLSRINSINKIDRSKLVLKSKDDEEDQVPKSEKPQVNKLRISEEMFTQSASEGPSNEAKHLSVGKIDTSKLFEQTEEVGSVKKEIIEVKKLRISEDAFKEESDEKLAKLKNEKLSRVNSISKIDRSKLILKSHDDDSEAPVKPEKPQVNRLQISEDMFVQSSLDSMPNEEQKVIVGKIDTSKLFEQNDESAPFKKEMLEVKKLQFSEEVFREDTDEKLQQLKKDKLSRVNSINKIDRSKLVLKSKDDEEEPNKPEKPQVHKLQISETMFSQSSSDNGSTPERITVVGKIDKSMLQFSSDESQIKRTVEDAPVNISKLNVSEAMFMQSCETEDESVKQTKLQRNQSIKKMDSSRYLLSNSDADSEIERRPSITANVGKLNMDGLFSSASESAKKDQPRKRNLQELMKEEKEKAKMPTIQKNSMHAQRVRPDGEFEEDEVVSAQAVDDCFTAPSLPGSAGRPCKLKNEELMPAFENNDLHRMV